MADAYGNFESDETVISAESFGKIVSFDKEEGEELFKGEILAVIDTSDLIFKKESVLKEMDILKSKLLPINSQISVIKEKKKNVLRELKRFKKLVNEKSAPQKQVDDLSGNINIFDKEISNILSQKQILNSQKQLYKIKLSEILSKIKKCYLKVPMNSILLNKYIKKDEFAQYGRPIYKFSNKDYIYLRVYVSERELSSIKTGQNVELKIDTSGEKMKKYQGIISYISSKAEFTPKTIQTKDERVNLVYAVKIKVENDGFLKSGMPGEAFFGK